MRIKILGTTVPGREPTVNQLSTFELAINAHDGKLFYVNVSEPGGEVREFVDLKTIKDLVAASTDFNNFKVRVEAL